MTVKAAPATAGNPYEARPSTLLDSRTLARNAVLNLFGMTLPLLVAIVAIPFVARGLGAERFGLLALAWVVLGYFPLFDLGLGRATAKYIQAGQLCC